MQDLKKLEYMTEPELSHLLNMLGTQIVRTCEALHVEEPRFALLLFNDPEVAQYCSNCCREDIIKALREGARRLAAKQDVPR